MYGYLFGDITKYTLWKYDVFKTECTNSNRDKSVFHRIFNYYFRQIFTDFNHFTGNFPPCQKHKVIIKFMLYYFFFF